MRKSSTLLSAAVLMMLTQDFGGLAEPVRLVEPPRERDPKIDAERIAKAEAKRARRRAKGLAQTQRKESSR